MSKKGRKSVFIEQALHTQLSAIVPLKRAADKDPDLTLQGLVDDILAAWLAENSVRSFVEDFDATAAEAEAGQ